MAAQIADAVVAALTGGALAARFTSVARAALPRLDAKTLEPAAGADPPVRVLVTPCSDLGLAASRDSWRVDHRVDVAIFARPPAATPEAWDPYLLLQDEVRALLAALAPVETVCVAWEGLTGDLAFDFDDAQTLAQFTGVTRFTYRRTGGLT